MEGWMKGAVNGEGLLTCHVLCSLQTLSHSSPLPNLWNLSSKEGHFKDSPLDSTQKSYAYVPFICNSHPSLTPTPILEPSPSLNPLSSLR